jgi:Transposase DDE domain
MMPAGFTPFMEQAPFCVMTRLTLERLFLPERLDALFTKVAERQYQKELLFSQLMELMMSVVLCIDPSVHKAYRNREKKLSVSDQAIYDKLQCMEPGVCSALVADSAVQAGAVIDAMEARLPSWLPGFRIRVLDGNLLSKTQRRIKELRSTWAAALPGRVLAVYDQQLDLVTDVFLNPDAYDNERVLLDDVLESVRAQDMWIADSNFCTLKFLFGIEKASARFVMRQHGSLVGQPLKTRKYRGRTDTGRVHEQELALSYEGETKVVRRITLVLDKPTRDGDTEIHMLTNLRQEEATAVQSAELYRQRWTIEGRFYELAQTLNGEPNTLGYPKAALFAFCLALVASNAMALIRASLRQIHEPEVVEDLSRYYIAIEVRETYAGMMVALPPSKWVKFQKLSVQQLANLLCAIATQVDPKRYRKARRGPKKPPTPKSPYENGGHVSTQRLIDQRKKPPS